MKLSDLPDEKIRRLHVQLYRRAMWFGKITSRLQRLRIDDDDQLAQRLIEAERAVTAAMREAQKTRGTR